MNKSLIANLIAAATLGIGFLIKDNSIGPKVVSIGAFSLSGGLTNWIAIQMLFDKIPFLYGSGVIELKFEEFKAGLKEIFLEQFFKLDDIKSFSKKTRAGATEEFFKKIDTEQIFDALVDAVQQSRFNEALKLFGGPQALEVLREPIKIKINEAISNLLKKNNEKFDNETAVKLREEVSNIVSGKLNNLSPKDVKIIIEDIIRKHLGWLVVWGAVLGGFIGLLYETIR